MQRLWGAKSDPALWFCSSKGNEVLAYSLRDRVVRSMIFSPVPEAILLALSPTKDSAIFADPASPTIHIARASGTPVICAYTHQASALGATTAAFHPVYSTVFLVAFQDGSIAAFRLREEVNKDYKSATPPELKSLGCVSQAHRPTAGGHTVVDAKFLPSRMLKAVSIGQDGLCRLLDFARRGCLIRTWRMPAVPLCVAATISGTDQQDSECKPIQNNSPSDQPCTIAVACDNATVSFYNCLGIQQHSVALPDFTKSVLSLEWCRAPSPRRCSRVRTTEMHLTVQDLPILHRTSMQSTKLSDTNTASLGQPTIDRYTRDLPARRMFAVHPDELPSREPCRGEKTASGCRPASKTSQHAESDTRFTSHAWEQLQHLGDANNRAVSERCFAQSKINQKNNAIDLHEECPHTPRKASMGEGKEDSATRPRSGMLAVEEAEELHQNAANLERALEDIQVERAAKRSP